jgi:hypothetical protein
MTMDSYHLVVRKIEEKKHGHTIFIKKKRRMKTEDS